MPDRKERHVRIWITARHDDGASPGRRLLRPKPTEADTLRGIAALLCIAVVTGALAAYLYLDPGPPPEWPRTQATIIRRARIKGIYNDVRWEDQTGAVRYATIHKCSILRDGASMTIAYNPDRGKGQQEQEVCGPFNTVVFTAVSLLTGAPAIRMLWRGSRRSSSTRHRRP